jgi:hypothetical protein
MSQALKNMMSVINGKLKMINPNRIYIIYLHIYYKKKKKKAKVNLPTIKIVF